mgnify:CR=1 FL=1
MLYAYTVRGDLMRKIIHIDADCFFAAVEMRDDPALLNAPLAIGGPANARGVIATVGGKRMRCSISYVFSKGGKAMPTIDFDERQYGKISPRIAADACHLFRLYDSDRTAFFG